MRNWKNWLFPLLACLAVGALTLLPVRLSALRDDGLTGTVHLEELGEDSNFPVKPPDLLGRLRLLAQFEEGHSWLTAVSKALEDDVKEWLEAGDLAREELLQLEDIGLGQVQSLFPDAFFASRLFIRDQTDLSSANYLIVNGFSEADGGGYTMILDGETGQALSLELFHPALRKYLETDDPEALGRAFLDRLGLEYQVIDSTQFVADFRIPDSGTVYFVMLSREGVQILPRPDWDGQDDADSIVELYRYDYDSMMNIQSK